MRIAFIGLGVMGGPMAGHLASAGHALSVYNRTPGKAAAFASLHDVRVAASPAAAAEHVEVLALCVGADADVRGVLEEAVPHLAPGSLIVDHTTASAEVAREMAALATRFGCGFVDAPVSGGQAGAQNAKLTAMLGGSVDDCARAREVVAAYATTIVRVGDVGSGQLAKMCNQLAIAGVVQGLAESVHFARRAGLDPHAVLAAIGAGAAGSWQMHNRWASMVEGRYDFGFAVEWMRKDLGLVLDEARRNGSRLPLAALVDQFYGDVEALGGGRWDTSSLLARLEPPAGVDRAGPGPTDGATSAA